MCENGEFLTKIEHNCCSILVRNSPFSPIPPNYQGVYLRAQMELGGLLGHFMILNEVKFRLVTFLGVFGKLKILPKQKNFFFANFFTLTLTLYVSGPLSGSLRAAGAKFLTICS